MATVHQRGSPLTSGRILLWRTIPVLFISPILSSLVSGHDLAIYLPVVYGFLALVLVQYRNLCHEWSTWQEHIPKISEQDVIEWYSAKTVQSQASSDDESIVPLNSGSGAEAQQAMRLAVKSIRRGTAQTGFKDDLIDPVVSRIAKGMPFAEWLLKKEFPDGKAPQEFSPEWFNTLSEAFKKQQQLFRGLKEHNILILFRYARHDVCSYTLTNLRRF